MLVKAAAAIITMLLVGVVSGLTMTWWEFTGVDEVFVPEHREDIARPKVDFSGTVAADAPRAGQPAPKITFPEGTEHDFGVMDVQQTRSHSFLIKNDGEARLLIEVGSTTCKCTISGAKKNALAPGETTEVTLSWTPPARDTAFRQEAELLSNDPNQAAVKLVIRGRVQSPAWLTQTAVAIPGLEAQSSASRTVDLCTSVAEDFQIENVTFSQPESASYFDVSAGDLVVGGTSGDGQPMAASRPLTVTVRPGLPIGPFHQTVSITTTADDQPLSLDISGTIVGPINVIGPGYNKELGALMFGRVDTKLGLTKTFWLIVKGPHRDQTTFTLDPTKDRPNGVFDVQIGEATDLGGQARRTEITLTVPPGTPLMSWKDTEAEKHGQLVFRTTHPDFPELIVPVYFEVVPTKT